MENENVKEEKAPKKKNFGLLAGLGIGIGLGVVMASISLRSRYEGQVDLLARENRRLGIRLNEAWYFVGRSHCQRYGATKNV